jgi:hypothetical protein
MFFIFSMSYMMILCNSIMTFMQKHLIRLFWGEYYLAKIIWKRLLRNPLSFFWHLKCIKIIQISREQISKGLLSGFLSNIQSLHGTFAFSLSNLSDTLRSCCIYPLNASIFSFRSLRKQFLPLNLRHRINQRKICRSLILCKF